MKKAPLFLFLLSPFVVLAQTAIRTAHGTLGAVSVLADSKVPDLEDSYWYLSSTGPGMQSSRIGEFMILSANGTVERLSKDGTRGGTSERWSLGQDGKSVVITYDKTLDSGGGLSRDPPPSAFEIRGGGSTLKLGGTIYSRQKKLPLTK